MIERARDIAATRLERGDEHDIAAARRIREGLDDDKAWSVKHALNSLAKEAENV